jgi:molybdopterin converting factor subunit 1
VQVRVLYFGGIREAAGRTEEALILEAREPTVQMLARELEQRYPALSGRLSSVRFAVNESFVALDRLLEEADTVAVIPPVQGG